MDIEEASARRVGQTLKDKWVLERLLGVGGMASVYLGRHKIGRLEAIKILHPEVAASEQIRARFEQEARAVNSLRHPGVVEVRDIDVTEDGAPFLVMEFLEGESLSTRARREPALTVQDVLRLAGETLEALAAVHARGIIHRDIKPDNLFITLDGRIKVLDFGIARVRSGGDRALATQVGVTLGTMAYMPPEQARGLEIDARADVYAVGATIYRLLSGRIIHDAATNAELVMKAMCEPAPPLDSVAPSVPATICAVVDRALAFDRADRYPDALTMKADLDAAAGGHVLPYASNAPPLPARSPSSEMFAMRDSFFGEVPAASAGQSEPTFVPPVKVAPASTPNVVVAPSIVGVVVQPATAPGVAPEVARTRHAAVDVPSAAMPSARVVIAAPPSSQRMPAAPVSPASHRTIVSQGTAARTPAHDGVVLTPFGQLRAFATGAAGTPPNLFQWVAVGVALLFLALMGGVFAIVVIRAYFDHGPTGGAGEPTPVLAPTPTAKPAPAPTSTSKKSSKKKGREDD